MDMMKCLAHIEKNLEMPLSVRQIAEQMGYSEYHFSREFKRVMGTSIMDYVIRRKLVKASEMLISGKSVLETAVQFGWQSHGGFTKAFKREYGFSPSLLKMMMLQISDLGGYIFMKKQENFLSKEELLKILKEAMEDIEEGETDTFYHIACEAYAGMKRYSGEEYVTHPLNVAIILAQMEADKNTVYAGLFYDVFYDVREKQELIVSRLPEEIRQILMEAVRFDVKQDVLTEQKEAAVMVKLADRLHNMRTLDFLEENRRPQKAKETIEFFMPMAQRLGNQKLIEELGDLSLTYLK